MKFKHIRSRIRSIMHAPELSFFQTKHFYFVTCDIVRFNTVPCTPSGMYKALSYCVYGGHARAVLSGARTVTLPILSGTAAQFSDTAGQSTPATKSSAPTH